MSDPAMPGSRYFPQLGSRLQVTFHPEDVNEPVRVVYANTFTELVIVLQSQWQPADSYLEIKWVDASTNDVSLPEMDDASLKPAVVPAPIGGSRMAEHYSSSTPEDGDVRQSGPCGYDGHPEVAHFCIQGGVPFPASAYQENGLDSRYVN